jgi:hypothetical protein
MQSSAAIPNMETTAFKQASYHARTTLDLQTAADLTAARWHPLEFPGSNAGAFRS